MPPLEIIRRAHIRNHEAVAQIRSWGKNKRRFQCVIPTQAQTFVQLRGSFGDSPFRLQSMCSETDSAKPSITLKSPSVCLIVYPFTPFSSVLSRFAF